MNKKSDASTNLQDLSIGQSKDNLEGISGIYLVLTKSPKFRKYRRSQHHGYFNQKKEEAKITIYDVIFGIRCIYIPIYTRFGSLSNNSIYYKYDISPNIGDVKK
jgi:hypothetical protein